MGFTFPSPPGNVLDEIDECTWGISWATEGWICENGNLCPYMANQTLPNKDSQIHRVFVVWDMPLWFTQRHWTVFSAVPVHTLAVPFLGPSLRILFPKWGFAKVLAYTPFTSILILCSISTEGIAPISCFPTINFLLTNLKPKFLISTSLSNQVYFSISLHHEFLIQFADWIQIWSWQM